MKKKAVPKRRSNLAYKPDDWRMQNYNWDLQQERTLADWQAIHAALLMDIRESSLMQKTELASIVRGVMEENKAIISDMTHSYLLRIEEALQLHRRPHK